MRKTLPIILVLCLLLVVSCVTLKQIFTSTKQVLTSEQRYVEALTLFNSVFKVYLDQYDMATPTTQAKWRVKVDPIAINVSNSLDMWKVALGDKAKEETYILLKNKFLLLLFECEILKVEE